MTRILVAGMRRSGSTWMYNVVRLALIQAGHQVQCGLGWPSNYRADATHEVIKEHQCCTRYIDGADVIFTSRRHLRDIVSSALHMGIITDSDVPRFLAAEIKNHGDWIPLTDLEIVYEEMVQDKIGHVEKILDVLGLDVDATQIHEQVEALPVPAEPDPVTLLWPKHRASSPKQPLTEEVERMIADRYREWLTRYGYAT